MSERKKMKKLADSDEWNEYLESLQEEDDEKIQELNPERDFRFFNNDDLEEYWDEYE